MKLYKKIESILRPWSICRWCSFLLVAQFFYGQFFIVAVLLSVAQLTNTSYDFLLPNMQHKDQYQQNLID